MKYKSYIIFLIPMLIWACSSGSDEQTESKEKRYTEQYRPQYHFSPDSAWMNDPNGMVYYDGEYHLFYQYYPDSTVWGPMHWGHAVSTDLVHWQHLPIALYPDSLGYIFSGSAVVDWKNTSGLGTQENPPLIAIYTYHNALIAEAGGVDVESQAIAYSLDKGRSWIKYEGNPVIPNDGNRDFRDPNVFWNEDIQKWNLVLSAHDHVQIYSSDNLKDWKYESDFGVDAGGHGGVWECPDLFPLKVDDTDETKWVLIVNINPGGPNGGSATQYFTGEFDGCKFTADTKETKWLDWGHDNYAGVTWADVPKEDGRRIFMGWMSNWDYAQVVPTKKWRSAMTLPRVLSLVKKKDEFIVRSTPVEEINKIINTETVISNQVKSISDEVLLNTKGINLNQSHLVFDFELGDSIPHEFGIILENNLNEQIKFGYVDSTKQFQFDRTQSGNLSFSEKFAHISTAPYQTGSTLNLEIFIDAASMEIFVDNGDLVMTEIFFSTQPFSKLKIFSNGQAISMTYSQLAEIKSIW
nr:glycoside hydrolase family 32 protein [uncultured Carboxylicivirga sp.]